MGKQVTDSVRSGDNLVVVAFMGFRSVVLEFVILISRIIIFLFNLYFLIFIMFPVEFENLKQNNFEWRTNAIVRAENPGYSMPPSLK